jgi:hypothetical protein
MKLKDITDCPERWSTPLGTMDLPPTVADGCWLVCRYGAPLSLISSWSGPMENISAR